MNKLLDYYNGFEGEPEIRISIKHPDNVVISMWSSYFDEIIGSINAVEGNWIGVAELYQLHEAWYENGQYKIEDLNTFLKQLLEVSKIELSAKAFEILNHLTDVLLKAIKTKQDVYILYS